MDLEGFEMPTWNYGHRFGSNINPEFRLLPRENMLALAYLRSKYLRIHEHKKSWLAAFEGAHRDGKSWTATLFGAMLDPTFIDDMDNRIVHGHESFTIKIKEFDKKKIYGGVIVADEAGVSGNFSSGDYQAQWMHAISSIFQMFGYLHPVVLFIAPDKSFIESKIRRMFHTIHRVSRPSNEYSVVQPYNLRYNAMKKAWLPISPVIRFGNTKYKMKHFRIKHYPVEIGKRYEALEQIRKPVMLEGLDNKIKASQIQEAKKTYDNKALATQVYNNYHEYETKRSKPDNVILDKDLIKIGLGIPMPLANWIKTFVEKRIQSETIRP